jgi:hypothetical protein
MKLLNIKTLVILKLVLLFNGTLGWADNKVISSDKLILKISDQVFALSDFRFQFRNLKALDCIYSHNSIVIQYFGRSFLTKFDRFLEKYPEETSEIARFHKNHEFFLKQLRFFFKGIKYADDQKLVFNETLESLIKESASLNRCDQSVLKENKLKANFVSLLRLELYLRTRYSGSKEKVNKNELKRLKDSIDLFVESIDKQLPHEYFQ